MEIKELEASDLAGIFSLITDIYDENPMATWFSSRPTVEMIESLLGYKLIKITEKEAVDYVATEDNRVIGECEVIKDQYSNGWLGIIVSAAFRSNGIGKKLLGKAIDRAKIIGIKNLFAEVARNNSAINFFLKNGFTVRGFENKDIEKAIDNGIILLEMSL
ncbi:MAG: GNAT family N-acetyltransferase [Candidatus Micrarchaeia archaeon]